MAKAPKTKTPKREKAVVCGCPPGATTRVQGLRPGEPKTGDTQCILNRRPVSMVCTRRALFYTANTKATMVDTPVPSTFNYTTPSAVQKISKESRAQCVVSVTKAHAKKGKKKGEVVERKRPLPFRCPPGSIPDKVVGSRCLALDAKGKPTSTVVESIPDVQCGPTGDPCGSKRTACPVQLVYKAGLPALRFCVKAGNKKPGWLVPVVDPQRASGLAEDACAQWSANKRKFTEQNAAVIAAKAARAGYARPKGSDAPALGRSA